MAEIGYLEDLEEFRRIVQVSGKNLCIFSEYRGI